MKLFSFLPLLITALLFLPASTVAQVDQRADLFSLEVAKAGCCKVRQSTKLPWVKTNKEFGQCKNANSDDGDKIYQSTGLVWWDRSC